MARWKTVCKFTLWKVLFCAHLSCCYYHAEHFPCTISCYRLCVTVQQAACRLSLLKCSTVPICLLINPPPQIVSYKYLLQPLYLSPAENCNVGREGNGKSVGNSIVSTWADPTSRCALFKGTLCGA